jgi:hypothetical protein
MAKGSGGSTIVLRGAAARRFVALLSAQLNEPVRSCRLCGCTDLKACRGGCVWVSDRLCSACLPSVEETLDGLSLVAGTEHILRADIVRWTPDQRADAHAWAVALHLRASDNHVTVPERPTCTIPAGEVTP